MSMPWCGSSGKPCQATLVGATEQRTSEAQRPQMEYAILGVSFFELVPYFFVTFLPFAVSYNLSLEAFTYSLSFLLLTIFQYTKTP